MDMSWNLLVDCLHWHGTTPEHLVSMLAFGNQQGGTVTEFWLSESVCWVFAGSGLFKNFHSSIIVNVYYKLKY